MARGPGYPYVDLEQAVDFARKLYQYSKRSPADPNAVVKEAWNYSPTSSSSKKTLAALKYYGLIEDVSNGNGRTIRLTDRAYRILLDDVESAERKQALRDAVLSPKAYSMCWTRWGAEMPASMRSALIFNEGFVESTVDSFIADYKKSVEYANLSGSESLESPNSDESIKQETSHSKTETKAPVLAAPSSEKSIFETPSDYRKDVFSLSEGDVCLTWPKTLSKEGFEDLSDWLDLVRRKIQRSVALPGISDDAK